MYVILVFLVFASRPKKVGFVILREMTQLNTRLVELGNTAVVAVAAVAPLDSSTGLGHFVAYLKFKKLN